MLDGSRDDLLLVGCGKMGGALLEGWLARGVSPERVLVVEPAAASERAALVRGVQAVERPEGVPADFQARVVVLAVKPQMMNEVVPHYARFVEQDAVFLSIAAGTRIANLQRHLGQDAAIVRVMPNTPAAIRRGMSVLCANPRTTDAQCALCGELMAAVGEIAWIDDEGLMDAVTAVSGSGPAYVFLLIESLIEAGAAVGLDEGLARKLAVATVAGAGELARQSNQPPDQLRVNVTSPGGTTEAALQVLMTKSGLPALMKRAVKAAEKRGRQLAG